MGLHVNLEHGGLSACLECDMLIVDGEEGCITYANELFTQLEEVMDNTDVDLLRLAYELQHYQYYALEDEVAAKILVRLYAFVHEITDIDVKKIASKIINDSFFYQRNIDTTVTIDKLEGAKDKKRVALMKQYIYEVVERYADYHEIISQ